MSCVAIQKPAGHCDLRHIFCHFLVSLGGGLVFCSRTLVGWQIGGDMRDLRVRFRLDLRPRNLLHLRFLLELGVLVLSGTVTSQVGDAQGGQGGT